MGRPHLVFVTVAIVLKDSLAACPDYVTYAGATHEPVSTGRYRLSAQRPDPPCRTFNLAEVETTINEMKDAVADPDLFRLFENTFPNTLDTTISWKGTAAGTTDEEAWRPARVYHDGDPRG